MTEYLHQCLRVITGPLLEVSSLLKPSKAREEGGECNAETDQNIFNWILDLTYQRSISSRMFSALEVP